MENYKISQSINRHQVQVLTRFMSEHTDLARGKLKALNAKQLSHYLWQTLGNALNEKGPPVRTVTEWRKVWADYKYKVKSKLRYNKNSSKMSIGGRCDKKPLDMFELSVVESAGLEAAVGTIKICKSLGTESSEEPQASEEGIQSENDDYEIIHPVKLFVRNEVTTQSEPEKHAGTNEICEGKLSSSSQFKEKKVFKLPVNRKRKFNARNSAESILVKEAYDVMKNMGSNCYKKDDCQIYGDYVASKLRHLDKRTKNQVEHMVNDILYRAALGEYDNRPNIEYEEQNDTPQPEQKIFLSKHLH